MNAATAKPRDLRRKNSTRLKSLALTLTLLTGGLTTLAVYAAADIPFVISAYDAASDSAASSRVSTSITLKNGAATIATADGKLAKSGDLLVGKLPMNVSVPAIANKGASALNFSVSKSGRVGLQWLLNGSPLGGAEMKYFDADVTGNTLTKEVTLQGMKLQLTVALKKGFAFRPGGAILVPMATARPGGLLNRPSKTTGPLYKPNGGIVLHTIATPTPKPMIVIGKPIKFPTPTPKPQKAVGRIINVVARLVITNSSDGVADNNVELVGRVFFQHRQLFDFHQQKATKNDSFESKPVQFYDEYGPTNKMAFMLLDGEISDYDHNSPNDEMWAASKTVNLRELAQHDYETVFPGDNKSESATLYLHAIPGPDIMEDVK